jgi:hypothetical protein
MNYRSWLVVFASIVAVLAGGTRAQAQFGSREQLPNANYVQIAMAFTVNGEKMPAGRYKLEVPEPGVVVFRDMGTQVEARAPVITRLDSSGAVASDAVRIVFDKVGDTLVASEVWFPRADGFLVGGTKEAHTHQVVKARPKT